MTSSEFARRYIGEFLAAVGPLKEAYQNDSFSYVAVETPTGPVLVQGSLFLNVQKPEVPFAQFRSKRVRAGHFYLADGGLTREAVIEQLFNGKFATPHGELIFPANPSNKEYGAHYLPYHDIGLRTQSRLIHISLLGNETREYIEQPQLDWGLRAASEPYDGLQDLLNEFRPGAPRGVCCVEIAALGVVAIDATSQVNGEEATLLVRAALGADPSKIAVGFRILTQGNVVARQQLQGTAFAWEDRDGLKVGTAKFSVPRAAVVHAIATYAGMAQQHYYFGDPNSFQNPRRAAYEAFDSKLGNLSDILVKAQTGRESKNFEAAIPWIFWMLGFAPIHIGLPRLGEVSDAILAAPNGNLAVVECTVGLLKDDDKLPKLHDRVQAVRRNLDTSSMRHVRVLPVIVTAKSLEEVQPDMEMAEKFGIYVIARDGLERLLQRTLVPLSADQLYEEAEQAVKAAQDARNSQGALQFGTAPPEF